MTLHLTEQQMAQIPPQMWLQADPALFGRRVLGKDIEPYHCEWIDAALESKQDGKPLILIAPRGHSKSTIMSLVMPLWLLINDRNIRILIVSNSGEQSATFLRDIKSHIETNPVFRGLWGDLVNRTGKWNEREIIVRGRTKIAKEPSIAVSSTGGSIISRHVDVLICDDIIDKDNSRTRYQRESVADWFWQTLLPTLEPGGLLIFVGTRWHHEDMAGELMAQPWNRVKTYKSIEQPQLETRVDDDGVERAHIVGGQPLWPSKWSLNRLDKQWMSMGPIFFNCQYQNDPSGMKGQYIEYEWIQYFLHEPEKVRYFMGVDVAISQKATAANSAVVVIGVEQGSGNIFVVHTSSGRWHVHETKQHVMTPFQTYRPISAGMQDVAIDQIFREALGDMFPVHKIVANREDKITRTLRHQLYFSQKRMFFKKEQETTLVRQLLDIPRTDKWDLVDALWNAMEAAVHGTVSLNGLAELNEGNDRETANLISDDERHVEPRPWL